MKSQGQKKADKGRPRKIEQDYTQIFTPHPLPYKGLYTDEDSLEQPSQLKYVPSTTTPSLT
jgi:hypothetical protein